MKSIWLSGLLIGVLALGMLGLWRSSSEATEKIKAVTFQAHDRPSDASLKALVAAGVTHVSVVPFGWQVGHDDPNVRMNQDATSYTGGDRGVTELASRLDSLGIKVILKPHIWIQGSSDASIDNGAVGREVKWRDAIGFEQEDDWITWEESYRTFMLHYARLAEEIGAPILCIGTELKTAAHTRVAFWEKLAQEVRTVYSGKLTYAANWWEEYEDIPWWSSVDYIGVQAYFPVTGADSPDLEDMFEGWKVHASALKGVQMKFDRPLLITEIGYRSVGSAAEKPWVWLNREETEEVPDFEIQALLYEAFFQTFWDESWVAGAIFWMWYPESEGGATDPMKNLDFTPQGKPAEAVLTRWFKN